MSKFLEGVERHTPNENEGKGPFRVEYRDVVGNLMATVVINDDVGSSYEEFIKFADTTNGEFELAEPAIKPEAAVEENETRSASKAEVDSAVQALAATASSGVKGLTGSVFGTSAQKAKAAVKARAKVNKEATPAFIKATEELEQALKNAAR
tara:strand:+ start:602 stop:1057 length:456 start_codon:yes stop_codon:yes gene_type:complete